MPRIPSTASCPRPAGSWRWNCRRGRASGSIPASRTGSEVTPFYDPMIAKVIAHARTRDAALDRLAGALDRTVVAGPRSNVAFLAALCRAAGLPRRHVRHRLHRAQSRRAGAAPQLDPAAAALRRAAPHRPRPGAHRGAARRPTRPRRGMRPTVSSSAGARRLRSRILVDGQRATASRGHTGRAVMWSASMACGPRRRCAGRERGSGACSAQGPADGRRAQGTAPSISSTAATAGSWRRCTARCWRSWSSRAPR